jgi:guanylate kinase
MDGDARPAARLTVLTGPSWAGRDSVLGLVRARAPFVRVPVSVTTRRRRDDEVDGVHYTFVNRTEFDRMIAEGRLLEWAEVGGSRYGTPRAPVEEWLRAGEPVLVALDAAGARLVRAAEPGACLVELTAPGAAVGGRLPGGDADVVGGGLSGGDADVVGGGLSGGDADVVVVNDSAERAAGELVSLLGSSCLTPARPPVGG